MPFVIKIMGRYDYNVTWLRDLLLPSWLFKLGWVDLLTPDLEGAVQAALDFDLMTFYTGNDWNPLAWAADDVE